MALPHGPEPDPGNPDLADLAARAAKDPSTREFLVETRRAIADGTIWDQVAEQTELRNLLEEHGR
ncbi:MAG: hypothetical protein ACYC1D_05380 [Acidimicrobiales bacterium]